MKRALLCVIVLAVFVLGWPGGLSFEASTARAQAKPKEESQTHIFYGPGRLLTPFLKSPGHVTIHYAYELATPFSIQLLRRAAPGKRVEVFRWDGPKNSGAKPSGAKPKPRIVLKGSERLELSGEFRLEIAGPVGWVVSVQTSKTPIGGE